MLNTLCGSVINLSGFKNIGGVKNPRTGCITAESYGEIILDENIKAPADCELRLWDGNWIYKL